jgi:DNA-directed RNA polymerase subunit H
MLNITNNRILSIYNSRKNILEILESQGYDTSGYAEFSSNEIDAMYSNSQLDMLISKPSDEKKVYIKYFLQSKQMRKENLDDFVEDLFTIESILTKNDTLVIIANEDPNETITNKVRYLYDHDGIFVVIHNIKRLQFNILKHYLVPKIDILDEAEVEALKKKFNLKTTKNLPDISRFDPQALAICLRPGQVCKLMRKSATAMTTEFYRLCV